jgi:hypothetical protein
MFVVCLTTHLLESELRQMYDRLRTVGNTSASWPLWGDDMGHEVFISHAHQDKRTADAVCSALEAAGDTPAVRPRAKLRVDFQHLRDGPPEAEEAAEAASLDLFEPPEHIRWLDACSTIKAVSPTFSLQQIAAQLGVGRMTVKRALGYARLMKTMGVANPYRELKERPAKASRWHRKRPRR